MIVSRKFMLGEADTLKVVNEDEMGFKTVEQFSNEEIREILAILHNVYW
jgi:hypothetical protein